MNVTQCPFGAVGNPSEAPVEQKQGPALFCRPQLRASLNQGSLRNLTLNSLGPHTGGKWQRGNPADHSCGKRFVCSSRLVPPHRDSDGLNLAEAWWQAECHRPCSAPYKLPLVMLYGSLKVLIYNTSIEWLLFHWFVFCYLIWKTNTNKTPSLSCFIGPEIGSSICAFLLQVLFLSCRDEHLFGFVWTSQTDIFWYSLGNFSCPRWAPANVLWDICHGSLTLVFRHGMIEYPSFQRLTLPTWKHRNKKNVISFLQLETQSAELIIIIKKTWLQQWCICCRLQIHALYGLICHLHCFITWSYS